MNLETLWSTSEEGLILHQSDFVYVSRGKYGCEWRKESCIYTQNAWMKEGIVVCIDVWKNILNVPLLIKIRESVLKSNSIGVLYLASSCCQRRFMNHDTSRGGAINRWGLLPLKTRNALHIMPLGFVKFLKRWTKTVQTADFRETLIDRDMIRFVRDDFELAKEKVRF